MDVLIKDLVLKVLKHDSRDIGSIDVNTNLIDEHVLDSMSIFDIIVEIEKEYSIELDGEDIVPENFQNIENIVKMVSKYVEI